MANWVVLELSPRSESEPPDILLRAIRSALRDPLAEVFIPAVVTQIGEDKVTHHLIHGYAFVRNTLDPHRYFRLEGTRHIQTVLTEFRSNKRQLSCVTDADIDHMREQIRQETDQGIGVGDLVCIISGPYRNIEATVIEDVPEDGVVVVHVKLRSKESLVPLPRSFLKVVRRTPLSRPFGRLTTLRMWARSAKPILKPRPNLSLDRFVSAWSRYAYLEHKRLQLKRVWSFVASYELGYGSARIQLLRPQLAQVGRLTSWDQKRGDLSNLLKICYGDLTPEEAAALFLDQDLVRGLPSSFDLSELQARVLDLYWLEDALERMYALQQDVESLAHSVAKRTKTIQNVLVDGHNLALRCFYAPGMSTLTSKDGRPTGAILGFLRSLGALKKRCPEARVYVAWDGSSQRRKALCADYKATRAVRTDIGGFDQIRELQGILAKFGIWQAINTDEEADDIIATLVRGELRGQHNLIYTTDRDLLSLVTETTSMLMPGAGTRKEVLFDPAMVVTVFGVPASKLLHLRSFWGDSSDNLCGVPRVPKKILQSLVQAHGSIDGVYASGLTGLTKGQYERLRLAEPHVRRNVELMSLLDVQVSVLDPEVDVEGTVAWLRDINVDPRPLLKALLGVEID
jgi:5'-3' exonuclease/transcription antitermination factor NusG